MSELLGKIEQTIHARGLLRRGQKILVAVSGGVDSMVLLHVLHRLSKKNRWRLTVAHFNHQLRGRGSDADERLVVRTAGKLRVPVVAGRGDVKSLAETGGLSIEMAARKLRHEFLAKTARKFKISEIALAHHADDQVELFFLRLLRGSGSEGLAGMKWKNASPVDPKVRLIRPLLEQSKEMLRAYAQANKISFRDDASNESLDVQRNLIRHELLPLLRRKYQPALDRTVLRVMNMLGAESDLMNAGAENWLKGMALLADCKSDNKKSATPIPFHELPVALQRRCVQKQLLMDGLPVDFAWIERLRTARGKVFTVLPEIAVVLDEDGKVRLRRSSAPVSNASCLEADLENGERFVFGRRKFSWSIQRQRSFRLPPARERREVFDADKVGRKIVLRHWRAGDRFQPIGMTRAVKLQDLFVNSKVPKARRHELIVATTAQNELFWVENLRISEQFKLTPQTTRRLIWCWKPC